MTAYQNLFATITNNFVRKMNILLLNSAKTMTDMGDCV